MDPDKPFNLEDTVKLLASKDSVLGVIVLDSKGLAIHSTFDKEKSYKFSQQIISLLPKAQGFVKDYSSNDLNLLRLRTNREEILIVPSAKYSMAVIQSLED
eukprot:CAMPEP_0174251524 /NCGR_PEP_ID=MMETSP0439-20130205/1322_1 /TAXON_ID=0 /ORGANISM="Stereomyxa ramosa, Strain Chinc5" /LENGTH=100 /DNA_ID=CAMNT_0015331859 /DNA_START=13 /DNA_END=315 /DNA_ORIENTATION=-